MSDIEGKAAREAVSERGQLANFNFFTRTLIFARALSGRVQSMVTLLRTWVTSSVAMTFRLSPARERFRSCS